jgi:hypothetical protein
MKILLNSSYRYASCLATSAPFTCLQVTFKEVSWNVSFVYSAFCAVRDLVLRDLSFVMGEHTEKTDVYAVQLSLPYIAANSALMWNDSAVESRTSAIHSFLTNMCARTDLHDSSNAVNALSAFLQVSHHSCVSSSRANSVT